MRRKLPPAGLSFPLRNKKPQFPAVEGIEDCTRLTWSSSRRPGRVTRSPSVHLTGRSSGSWIDLLPAPSRGLRFTPVAFSRFRPQLQRRDRDGFAPSSLLTDRTCKCLYSIPFRPGSQGKSPGSARTRRCCRPPPGPGPPGPHLACSRNQSLGSRQMTHGLEMAHALGQDDPGGVIELPEAGADRVAGPVPRCGPRCPPPAPGRPSGPRPPGPLR